MAWAIGSLVVERNSTLAIQSLCMDYEAFPELGTLQLVVL
jgi:hypothetical protein